VRASVVFGLVNGLNIALLALGLVLVYKAGRFVNFAHAQLGVVPALVLAKLSLDHGVSWYLAFPVAVALGALTGAAAEFVVIRRLAGRSRVSLLIATIGLAEVLLAFTYFTWIGPNRFKLATEHYPIPFDTHLHVDTLVLRGEHVLTIVLVPALAAALTLVFRYTTMGKVIRAAASNPDAAGLAGISVRRVSTITWALAGALSAVSAVLASPGQAVFDQQAFGPSLLLRALGAAAIGGFTSMPWAFAAGVGLGVVESVALHVTRSGGIEEAIVFAAILAGLFLRARAIEAASQGTTDQVELSERPVVVPPNIADRFLVRRQRILLVSFGLFAGLVAPLLPVFRPEARQFLLTLTLVFGLVGVSLTVLTGWGGQVSLGQFAFLGVGAFVAARLAPHGVSVPLQLAIAGGVGAALAVLVGLPALRLSGLTLAVTTLGLAVVAPAWLFRQHWFAPQGTITAPAARLAGLGSLSTQRSIYYLALVVLGLACLAVGALRHSGPGRAIRAVRDNEAAAASFGVSPSTIKLGVFALSGFLAAAAGVIWLAAARSVSAQLFPPQQSLVMLSISVIGGLASVPGAIIGAFFVYGIPALLADTVKRVFSNTLQFQLFVGGGGLLFFQVVYPGGVAAVCRGAWERVLALVSTSVDAQAAAAGEPSPAEAEVLDVREVTVRFGPMPAVDRVSIHVGPGEIVGLIGSNGAGKTTLVNAIAGALAPESGSIRVFGRELAGMGPEYRAHFGVGRTFQDARLFAGLTVRETVSLGLQRQARVGLLASLVGAPWVSFTERALRAKGEEIIDSFGLTRWADVRTNDLSTGLRRLCDLAAQVATSPRLLLLDEPTAGVAQRDAEAFGPLLRRIAGELGSSVLIIEHDMPLMLGVADRIYCLDGGRVIAEGTPAQVRADPKVIASYLGTDEAAIARSGAMNGARHRTRTPRAAKEPTG